MIFELFLITELLRNTVGTPSSTVVVPSPTPTPVPTAVTPTKGSGASLVGDLFAVGPITEIKIPIDVPMITPKEASDAYLDAIQGIEITSLPYLGKR